jgi:hypothetical protein
MSVNILQKRIAKTVASTRLKSGQINRFTSAEGLEGEFRLVCGDCLTSQEREAVQGIYMSNMKDILVAVKESIDEDDKRKYLFASDSFFVLVYACPGERTAVDIVGFAMFRFEYDDLDDPAYPVVFVYELQLAGVAQSKGVGAKVLYDNGIRVACME